MDKKKIPNQQNEELLKNLGALSEELGHQNPTGKTPTDTMNSNQADPDHIINDKNHKSQL